MLALTGTTGKIGGAVLSAILEYNLYPPSQLIICSSSDPNSSRWASLRAKGVQVRQSNYDDPTSMIRAFSGAKRLFLVSTPRIDMDFNAAPHGSGREKHHFAALEAAWEAGVREVVYTSLAFGYGVDGESKAGVMRAHLRTEEYLRGMREKGMKVTVLREGLYNESWPLYLGYFDVKGDERGEVVVAGDGGVSWTAVRDLGVASALVVVDEGGRYEGGTWYLSAKAACGMKAVAEIVGGVRGKDVYVKVVGKDEYVRHYVEERGKDRAAVEWWASSYEAMREGECDVRGSILEDLLKSKGLKPIPLEQTIKEMLPA